MSKSVSVLPQILKPLSNQSSISSSMSSGDTQKILQTTSNNSLQRSNLQITELFHDVSEYEISEFVALDRNFILSMKLKKNQKELHSLDKKLKRITKNYQQIEENFIILLANQSKIKKSVR
ncbi:Hypothetical_protein [Hexamita inflata]|uniref:Hypothetical_protein n=1 Tax=Hexamita inflata TaxID=28002 RepID=A0AA86UJ83_9EUKA|nr:Hypothetical protein HINF_LOCUS48000 [Hexamita inflata]